LRFRSKKKKRKKDMGEERRISFTKEESKTRGKAEGNPKEKSSIPERRKRENRVEPREEGGEKI